MGKGFFGSIGDWLFGGDDEESTVTTTTEPKYYQDPASSEAKSSWWNTLQDWGKSGSYGAVLPNYENVFQNAANRINQYYWGGPSAPGLIDKIKAGAAQRGVSDSPAIDVLKLRAGAEQGGQIKDLSTSTDLAKASAVEAARNNWMNSLMALGSQGQWGGTTTQTSTTPSEGALPYLLGGGIQLAGNYMLGNQLSNIYAQNRDFMRDLYGGGMSSTTPSSITQGNILGKDYGKDFGDWSAGEMAKMGLSAAKYIPGPQQPFVYGADILANMFL